MEQDPLPAKETGTARVVEIFSLHAILHAGDAVQQSLKMQAYCRPWRRRLLHPMLHGRPVQICALETGDALDAMTTSLPETRTAGDVDKLARPAMTWQPWQLPAHCLRTLLRAGGEKIAREARCDEGIGHAPFVSAHCTDCNLPWRRRVSEDLRPIVYVCEACGGDAPFVNSELCAGDGKICPFKALRTQ